MQKITDYTIVTSKLPEGFTVKIDDVDIDNHPYGTRTIFAESVKNYIEQGWQPLGRPFVVLDERWAQINQVMVKYAEEIVPGGLMIEKTRSIPPEKTENE